LAFYRYSAGNCRGWSVNGRLLLPDKHSVSGIIGHLNRPSIYPGGIAPYNGRH